MLGNSKCAQLLLSHGAPVKLKNKVKGKRDSMNKGHYGSARLILLHETGLVYVH